MNINFLKYRRFALFLMIFVIASSFLLMSFRGLNLTLDFTGGMALEVAFVSDVSTESLSSHIEKHSGRNDFSVKYFGSKKEIMVQSRELIDSSKTKQLSFWKELFNLYGKPFEIKRLDVVGPKIGKELAQSGLLSAVVALFLILFYVSFRFEWRFALSAVVALVHDVCFVLGFFSLFQFGFDLNVLGALLAIIGYSLNDTIVIFDRIRSRLAGGEKNKVHALINSALNNTLSRTLVTSLTTLLVLVALLLFGGQSVFNFAIALISGVLIGTYSSVFVATNVLVALGVQPSLSINKVNKYDLGNRP